MPGDGIFARQIADCYPNRKIEAIKLFREHRGLSLAETKAYVDRLWDNIASGRLAGGQIFDAVQHMLHQVQRVAQPPALPRAFEVQPPFEDTAAIDWGRELARFVPNKLEAIKHVRQRTGLGLKEAKDLVEQHCGAAAKPAEKRFVALKPKPASASVPLSGEGKPEYEVQSSGFGLILVTVFLLAAAAAAWFFFR